MSLIDHTFILQPVYEHEFDQMRAAFGTLVFNIAPLIEAGIPSLNELKKYLGCCFQELAPQLSTVESFDDVMKLVQNQCTIINICCLETIIDHYEITKAKQHIAKFNKCVNDFCENVKADICLKQNFEIALSCPRLICETIEIIVEWKTNECTLRHIKGLLSKAFTNMASSVQVRTIDDGNSIIIICYAPLRLMDFLLMSAKDNLCSLIKMEVTKLVIGYHTIYDKCKSDEVRNM